MMFATTKKEEKLNKCKSQMEKSKSEDLHTSKRKL